jgi:hypothetical protein
VRKPRVEILFVEACPNYRPAQALVERIANELLLALDVRLIEVRAADQAEELRFLGSPTIRVDGRDVEPGSDSRAGFGLACRVYRGVAGQPDEQWVRAALEDAA